MVISFPEKIIIKIKQERGEGAQRATIKSFIEEETLEQNPEICYKA